jgi:hypothetical protein
MDCWSNAKATNQWMKYKEGKTRRVQKEQDFSEVRTEKERKAQEPVSGDPWSSSGTGNCRGTDHQSLGDPCRR